GLPAVCRRHHARREGDGRAPVVAIEGLTDDTGGPAGSPRTVRGCPRATRKLDFACHVNILAPIKGSSFFPSHRHFGSLAAVGKLPVPGQHHKCCKQDLAIKGQGHSPETSVACVLLDQATFVLSVALHPSQGCHPNRRT